MSGHDDNHSDHPAQDQDEPGSLPEILGSLSTPQGAELQVRVFYLTHTGAEQQALISSTQSTGSFLPKKELLHDAVTAYFAVMGGTVLAVQLESVSPSRFSPELTRQAKVIPFPLDEASEERRNIIRRSADRLMLAAAAVIGSGAIQHAGEML